MDSIKQVLVALGVGAISLLGGCENDGYGKPCAMDSDCKSGVHCWCEPAQRGETSGEWMGECPGEVGTCLSPADFAAARDRVAATAE